MKKYFKYLSVFFGAISVLSLIVFVLSTRDKQFVFEFTCLASSLLCLLSGIARDLSDIRKVKGMQKLKQVLFVVFQFLMFYFFAVLFVNFLIEIDVLQLMFYFSNFLVAIASVVLISLLALMVSETRQKVKAKKN